MTIIKKGKGPSKSVEKGEALHHTVDEILHQYSHYKKKKKRTEGSPKLKKKMKLLCNYNNLTIRYPEEMKSVCQ